MLKKIISVLLACLMIFPLAVIPVFAEEAVTDKTYNLSDLEISDVLQPKDIIAWESVDCSEYLTITYVSEVPFNPADNKTYVDVIKTGGRVLDLVSNETFVSPDENLTFAGWEVKEIEVKSSGTNKLTLSAVWEGDSGDEFLYQLISFFKPVLKRLISGLLDFVITIAKIFA